jgi:hypothetical protein
MRHGVSGMHATSGTQQIESYNSAPKAPSFKQGSAMSTTLLREIIIRDLGQEAYEDYAKQQITNPDVIAETAKKTLFSIPPDARPLRDDQCRICCSFAG